MRIACALPVAGLLLGCTPTASSQPPEPRPVAATDESDAGPLVAVAREATAADDAHEPAAGNEPPPHDDGGEPSADDGEPASAGVTAPSSPLEAPNPSPAREPAPGPVASPSLDLPRALHATRDETCGNDAGVGESLKAFSLPTPDGKTLTQGSFRGRVLVVNFWGTWCKPCLKELPEFDQLYRRYRKHGMTLLAIATDADPEPVNEIVDKRKLGAKIAIDGEAYAGQYGSPKFPFTFIVDHKGVIRASYRGYRPECMGELEADIRDQLQVRADAKARRKR